MKDLIKVANELQKVMDFEEGGPPVDGTVEELTKWVEEAVDEIDYVTDKFSNEAVKYLTDLDLWKGPLLEEDEPEVEEAEVVEEVSDNLVDQVKAAGTMRDLKIICKDLDEFKSIRGQLTKYKTMKELREVMLGMLEEDDGKSEPKVKVEKKPVEKKEPAVKKVSVVKSGKKKRTKKAVVEEMITKKGGATIEEIAQAITDEEIDLDHDKNLLVVKLWLNKMGHDTKKAAIAKNPKFQAK